MEFFEVLKEAFTQESSVELARKQSAYLRDLFPFVGITKPKVHALTKEIFKKHPIRFEKDLEELVELLWNKQQREYHYVAMIILRLSKKMATEKLFPLYEKMIRENSWWDTVDEIAANIIGPFIEKHPSYLAKMDAWSEDPNFWIRRTSLIFQLRYKDKTDERSLFFFFRKNDA